MSAIGDRFGQALMGHNGRVARQACGLRLTGSGER